MVSRSSKEAFDTLKALASAQQQKSAVIGSSSRNILTESTAILNRWTEYWSGLYNYELYLDTSLLQSNQTPTQEAGRLPVPKQEVEEAVSSPSAGKCLQEWTTFPLSCLRMEAKQQQQSCQQYARRSGR